MTPSMTRRDTFAATLLVLATAVLLSIVSERIFVGDGLGYDGRAYAAVITRLDEVRSGAISVGSAMYLRMAPALALRAGMQATGVALTIPNVIVAFQAINIAMLTLAAWAFCRSADLAGLTRQGKWLGCLGMFCNYAVLKYNFYYPVLLDTASLTFATLLAWLYLARRTWLLLGTGVIAFSIGPNIGLLAFLLFAPPSDQPGRAQTLLARPLAAALAVLAAGGAWLTLSKTSASTPAIAVSLTFLGVGTYCLARAAAFSRQTLAQSSLLVRLGIVVVIVAVFSALPQFMPGMVTDNWFLLFFQYAQTVIRISGVRIGEFLVAHTLYFGPIFLIAVCLFAPTCRAARRLGPGWLAVLAFGLLQSLNPLSRQMIGILPFLALPTCLALTRKPLPGWFLWGLAIISLALSKVWQSINANADVTLPLHDQPEVWARYLESTGAWMREADYRWQGILILVLFVLTAAVLALLSRKRTAPTS